VFDIGNEVARYETVNEASHSALYRAYGVKMAAMTDGMARGINSMRLVGAHDTKKEDVSSNKKMAGFTYSLVPGVNKMASKSHIDVQGASI
jgi:hypothetical protein